MLMIVMNKIFHSIRYLLSHPLRAIEINQLYKHLKGQYRMTIVLVHSYRESHYLKISSDKNIKNNKATEPNLQDSHQPMIITLHDGLTHTGGLTDRLKGMCTLFSYAKKNESVFKIYFTAPFRLEKYLIPHNYDWTIESAALVYNLENTAVYTWEDSLSAKPFFQKNLTKEQLHIGCNSAECFSSYSELFHELFKPSELLESQVNYHLKKLGGKHQFISVSFRFQNLLGEFEEGNSTALNREEQEKLIRKCLDAIENLNDGEMQKILVTSDSNLFRNIASETYSYVYTYIIAEEVGHIDYAEAGKSKELTAFVDMFLISCAKKAFQVKSSKMYKSDFPNMAAKINNVPYEVIEI